MLKGYESENQKLSLAFGFQIRNPLALDQVGQFLAGARLVHLEKVTS
jgi:hypothetical protein